MQLSIVLILQSAISTCRLHMKIMLHGTLFTVCLTHTLTHTQSSPIHRVMEIVFVLLFLHVRIVNAIRFFTAFQSVAVVLQCTQISLCFQSIFKMKSSFFLAFPVYQSVITLVSVFFPPVSIYCLLKAFSSSQEVIHTLTLRFEGLCDNWCNDLCQIMDNMCYPSNITYLLYPLIVVSSVSWQHFMYKS